MLELQEDFSPILHIDFDYSFQQIKLKQFFQMFTVFPSRLIGIREIIGKSGAMSIRTVITSEAK